MILNGIKFALGYIIGYVAVSGVVGLGVMAYEKYSGKKQEQQPNQEEKTTKTKQAEADADTDPW